MRNLKRVAWVCFAGCCCAGLMLLAGERSVGTQTYCPSVFYGELGGVYMFGAYLQGDNCNGGLPYFYATGDSRMHQLGNCPDCPDPIIAVGNPLSVPEPSLVPQADPRFSGILR